MLSEFTHFMRDNLEPREDNDSTILNWLQLAIDLSSEGEANLNHELSDTLNALRYVKNNFSPKVFQESLRFATLSNEIINGAFCFNAGYTKEMVEKFAEDGLIECGYMPKAMDETENFYVVKILEPENSMVVFDNVSEKTVLRTIGRASTESIENGGLMCEHIKHGIMCRIENVQHIQSEPLRIAYEKALENTSAVRKMITFQPETGEVQTFDNQAIINGEINTGAGDTYNFGIRLM